MKHDPDPIENDPIWDLLRQSPARQAGPRFVDDTLRAARLSQPEPWWKKVALPLGLGAFASAVTAVVLGVVLLNNPPQPTAPKVVEVAPPASESLAVLDEFVRTEAVGIAADNPSEYTDAELVSLIAF
ncbi:hypothetical protein [Haloferula sargassicola]|uniref:Uncharacterized protein n=1 Tax=Haloferula sargassicola TaxID=490096 RepID=A0ABP9UIY8_9BACT